MILRHKWAKEAIKNKVFIENMNFHFLDLTVKLCAFDFDTYDGSTDEEKGGCRVVLKVKTIPFMYETLWLVFTNVEKRWVKVKQAIVFLLFFNENKVDFQAKSLFFYY